MDGPTNGHTLVVVKSLPQLKTDEQKQDQMSIDAIEGGQDMKKLDYSELCLYGQIC